MLRIIIFSVICLVFISAFCLYFFGPEHLHLLVWDLLERDIIYLNSGAVVHGWIWEEKNGLLIGETADKTIFNIRPSEYSDISKDALLYYLYELI